MKFSVKPFKSDRTQFRYVKCVAIIPASKKLGIEKRYQKTWKVRTVAPEFTSEEMKASFYANAKRWEQKVLYKIALEKCQSVEEREALQERIKNGQPPELTQEEIEV